MTEDTKKLLEELEKELQTDDLLTDLPDSLLEEPDEQTVSQVLEQLMAEPAFEDPDQMSVAQGDVDAYHNYSNDYGQEPQAEEDQQVYGDAGQLPEDEEEDVATKQEKLQIILMGAASVLSLGIIGVLIYWLEKLL